MPCGVCEYLRQEEESLMRFEVSHRRHQQHRLKIRNDKPGRGKKTMMLKVGILKNIISQIRYKRLKRELNKEFIFKALTSEQQNNNNGSRANIKTGHEYSRKRSRFCSRLCRRRRGGEEAEKTTRFEFLSQFFRLIFFSNLWRVSELIIALLSDLIDNQEVRQEKGKKADINFDENEFVFENH